LQYAIRKAVNHKGWEMNETHQFLVCTGDDNLLGKNMNTINKNMEYLFVACKEVMPGSKYSNN
jgi:hypothetical protein